MTSTEQVRSDFDEIAQLAESGASGRDRYDAFLLSLIPAEAARVLDVGCGLGRLTWAIATGGRSVVGVDLSPAMVDRARGAGALDRASFRVGNFLELDFGSQSFDCIVSAAALHHMDHDAALARMVSLLSPGGRLIVHDLRSNAGLLDAARGCVALAHTLFHRLRRTGRLRPSKPVRDVWARHGASESYVSLGQVRNIVGRLLPEARIVNHWLWRYTIVWDKPLTA
jgi:2-polyprenyl-3-methyl-5-hydroxy-6-metoxy-1,4-benzoquinol methylase